MNAVVLGLGYGDEGKGLVTDYLSSQLPKEEDSIVIRFSGGHQAGHTVQLEDGTRHIFSNFGSGTLRGLPTYWSASCTVDPIGIKNELTKLLKLGFKPKLYINHESPIVTPYDKKFNKVSEEARHGTCGVGFGKTKERENNHYSILAMDMKYPYILQEKLKLLKEHYYYFIDVSEEDLKSFFEAIDFINNYDDIKLSNGDFFHPIHGTKYNRIYEGSQGLMLDQTYGFFPHVTRSYLTPLSTFLGKDVEVFVVTRAYSTRHGVGPFYAGTIPNFTKAASDEYETNKTNIYQGEFRRAILDLDIISYGFNRMIQDTGWTEPAINLVVTCFDHVEAPYSLKHQDEIHIFTKKEEFIKKIISSFDYPIKSVFINESPVGNLLPLNLDT